MRDIDQTVQLLMSRGRGELHALNTEKAKNFEQQKNVVLANLDKLPDQKFGDTRTWLGRRKANVESYVVSNLMIDRILAEADGNPMLQGKEMGLLQSLGGIIRGREVEQMEMIAGFVNNTKADYAALGGLEKRLRKEFGGKFFTPDGVPIPDNLRDIGTPNWDTDILFSMLRNMSTVAALGWNVKSALRQSESLGIAADTMTNASRNKTSGWYWLAQGLKKMGLASFAGGLQGAESAAIQEMYEISSEARVRGQNINKEIRDAIGTTDPTKSKGLKLGKFTLSRDMFFAFTQRMDMGISGVCWWGAYYQAMNGDAGFDMKGLTDAQIHEKAVAHADFVLRSQQSPYQADYTQLQADPGPISLFTQFLGGVTPYFSHTYGMAQLWRRGQKSNMDMLRHLMNAYTLPVLVKVMLAEALRRGLTGGGDDDEEEGRILKDIAWGTVNGLTSPLPIVRDVVGIAQYGERSATIPSIAAPARAASQASRGVVKLSDGDVEAAASDFGKAMAVFVPLVNPLRQLREAGVAAGVIEEEW